jgi:ribose-phosphate pyrophosphokinase
VLISLEADSRIATALAAALEEPLAGLEERRFEDGEFKLRPLVDPHGADVFVIASLHGGPIDSPNDKLMRLLVLIATLRDHGAVRVTAVLPYLAFARKDRRTQPHDPLTLRCVAQLFEAVGVGQVIALEVHNLAAFENAFRCPTQHLCAHEVFDGAVAEMVGDAPLVVVSPDPGGVKRVQLWREALERHLARPVGFAMVDKRRTGGLVSSAHQVSGNVDGHTAVLLDDLIASGDTMRRGAQALRHAGAKRVIACAAHGLFTGNAADTLACPEIDRVLVTDSVPGFRLHAGTPLLHKLRVVSAVPLLARAIRDCRFATAL